MYRYRIDVEYIGEGLSGWQRQSQPHILSVQQIIEDSIKEFTHHNVTLIAGGRTDAGVSAYWQVAHFDLPSYYDPYKMIRSINHFTVKHNICIINCTIVPDNFHARFSAKFRHYVYKIINRNSVSVIDSRLRHFVHQKLNVDLMKVAANYLIGKHDFSSFRASGCQAKSPITTITEIKILKDGDYIDIYVSATAFLYHMVRNIVGTLLLVGKNIWTPERVLLALDLKNRSAGGPTAPAKGLFLLKIDY